MATSSKESSFESADKEEDDPSSLYDKLTASISENIKSHKAKNQLYMNEIKALQSELKSFKITGTQEMVVECVEEDNKRNVERIREKQLDCYQNRQQEESEMSDYDTNYGKKYEKYQGQEKYQKEDFNNTQDNTQLSQVLLTKELENDDHNIQQNISRNISESKSTLKDNYKSSSKERISTLDIRKALRQQARRLRGSPENSPKQGISNNRNNSSSNDDQDSMEQIQSLHKYDSEKKRKKSSKKKKKTEIITQENQNNSSTKSQDRKLKDKNKSKKDTQILCKHSNISKQSKKDINLTTKQSEHKINKIKHKTTTEKAEHSESSYSNCLTNNSLKVISNNLNKDRKLPYSPSRISLRISTSPDITKNRQLISPSRTQLNANKSPNNKLQTIIGKQSKIDINKNNLLNGLGGMSTKNAQQQQSNKYSSFQNLEENIFNNTNITKKKPCHECLNLLKRGVSTSHCSIHGFNSTNIASKMRF